MIAAGLRGEIQIEPPVAVHISYRNAIAVVVVDRLPVLARLIGDVIAEAVAALKAKLDGSTFDGSAKFSITGEGAIVIDTDGVRAGDEDTEVTLSADAETFRDILSGDLDSTSAFMGGRLKLDGDMGTAMRLAGHLS